MSSILKALRKLEEEKSRSREGSPDIARDILKRDPRRHSFSWMNFTAVASLVLALGVVGYYLMEKAEFGALPPELPQALHAKPPAPQEIPSGTTAPSAPPAMAPARTPSKPKALSESVAKKTQTNIPPALPKRLPETAKAPSSPEAAGKNVAASLPAIRLTGIAFREDRRSRLAVINDLPVMEGTVIAGARVVEISEDRVLLDFSGKSFEVLLEEAPAE